MSKVVGVLMEGFETEWHAPGVVADYDTLCGLDAHDPQRGHMGKVQALRGQKITCAQCAGIFLNLQALGLRRTNFDSQALYGLDESRDA